MQTISESAQGFPSSGGLSFGGAPIQSGVVSRDESRSITNEPIVVAILSPKNLAKGGEDTGVGQVLFVHRDHAALASPAKGHLHQIASLQTLNRTLLQDARSPSPTFKTGQDVMDRWNYLGIIDNPDRTSRRGNLERGPLGVTNVVVGGGAMVINYWAGEFGDLFPGSYKGEGRLFNNKALIHLWLVLTRVKTSQMSEGQNDGQALLGKRTYASLVDTDECWQFVPFCTSTMVPPHYNFYTGATFAGQCIYVGRSIDSRGDFVDGKTYYSAILNEILAKRQSPPCTRLPQCSILVA